jgi:hypothetical protein
MTFDSSSSAAVDSILEYDITDSVTAPGGTNQFG